MAKIKQLEDFIQPIVNAVAVKAGKATGSKIKANEIAEVINEIPSNDELKEIIKKTLEGSTSSLNVGFRPYIPEGTTKIAYNAFLGAGSSGDSVNATNFFLMPDIPDTVTYIGDSAFEKLGYDYASQLEWQRVPLPNHRTKIKFNQNIKINQKAFQNAYLNVDTLTIPANATIANYCFSGAKGIGTLVFEEGFTTIRSMQAFSSVKGNYVPNGSMYEVENVNMVFPSSMTVIEPLSIDGTKNNVYLPSLTWLCSVKSGNFSPNYSGYTKGLTTANAVYFGNVLAPKKLVISEENIGADKTIGCGFAGTTYFEEIVIPKNVEILSETFAGSQTIPTITFEEGSKLKMLLNSAFVFSKKGTLNLPSSLESIGNAVFRSNSLVIILNSSTPPTCESTSFSSFSGKVYVPKGSSETYKSATNWSTIASKIFENNNITFNVDSALLNNENALYSIDGGSPQQFTQTTFEGVNLSSFTVTSKDAKLKILVGTTQGGSDIGTVANATTVFTFTSDTTIYITKQ